MESTTTIRSDAPAWLRFTLVPGVQAAAQRALLDAFGTPEQALGATVDVASRVVRPDIAEALARGPGDESVRKALRWLEQPGHHLVTLADAAYPNALRQIHDPPPVLYVIGRPDLLNAPGIAIVGSRNATVQGMRDAEAFARALSEAGLTVVSGLALGIDAAAHRGGLAGAGSSLAVMGTGANRLYPKGNAALGAALAASGALVTEFPLDTPPIPDNFPRRNRLISGLSRGVLVVEAALHSGSLITAREAGEQGRDVFAIPGSIHSPTARGCHKLIKDGAKLVECADDILEELNLACVAPAAPQADPPAPAEDPLLEAIGYAPVSLDHIAERTGMDAAAISAQLARLELAGAVAGLAGGLFQRLTGRVIE